MLGFILLWAIFGPKAKEIDITDISFSTTSSSQLYFKNIRAYFYDIEERTDASYNLYRLKARKKSDSLPVQAVIIQNWRFDESYVLFENNKNKPLEKFQFTAILGDSTQQIKCDKYSTQTHYFTAAKLYFYLSNEDSLLFNGAPLDVQSKTALKTSLKDYFKLVGKLR